MVNHGATLHCDKKCINVKINHGQSLHYDKYCLDMKINHGQPWSNNALWWGLSQLENQLWSTMFILVHTIFILGLIPWVYNISALGLILVNHGQPWFIKSIMVNHGIKLHCGKDCLNMKFNHGTTLHYDKDFLDMKINHGQPWSNVVLWEGLSQYENKPW